MKTNFKTCEQCQFQPGTVFCKDCNIRFCYNCDSSIHSKKLDHTTDILSFNEMRVNKRQSQIQKEQQQESVILQGYKSQKASTIYNSNLAQKKFDNTQQQEELLFLDQELKKNQQLIGLQEEKWLKQLAVIEKEYQTKIQQFELDVKKSEDCLQEIKEQNQSENKISEMMSQLKSQLENQKSSVLQQVEEQKIQLHDKEQLLQNIIKQEKDLSNEINKKEQLIIKFKELISQQQKEKELIVSENEKIKEQLADIKKMLQNKLPELGLDENFFNIEDEEENQEGEEQQQVQQNDDSTDEEEPQQEN